MGFSTKQWNAIDSYVAPLTARIWDGRTVHITAMIKQAQKYLGNPYIVGAASSPAYGTDCSGLVMQSLYAGGLNLNPVVSSINHAHPSNEWNSRNLWQTPLMPKVAFRNRQRGDLVFFYRSGSKTIIHVGIYLGNNMMIDSWPNVTSYGSIYARGGTTIAGFKRPFI